MGNIVGIHKNEEIITVLKTWLKHAKEGRLTLLAATVIVDSEIDTEVLNTDESLLEALAVLHLLTAEVTDQIMNPTTEDE